MAIAPQPGSMEVWPCATPIWSRNASARRCLPHAGLQAQPFELRLRHAFDAYFVACRFRLRQGSVKTALAPRWRGPGYRGGAHRCAQRVPYTVCS